MAVPERITAHIDHAGVLAWAERGRWVTTDGGEVFVLDLPADGDETGPPVLVLHGFPTCSYDWREVVSTMAPGRRIVMFDFLGFGLSDKPDRRYGIHLHADTTEQLAEELGLERVALVTHDMGDSVGGELLARSMEGRVAFEVVERVVSNGSIYLDMAHLSVGQQLLLGLPDAPFDPASAGRDPSETFKAGIGETFAEGHPASADELEAQWQLVSLDAGNTLLARTIRYLEDRRLEERRYTGSIESHPSPLHVVWGELDPIARHVMTAELLAARPDATLATLVGVGHYPMIEAPAEFAAAVAAGLGRPDGEAAAAG